MVPPPAPQQAPVAQPPAGPAVTPGAAGTQPAAQALPPAPYGQPPTTAQPVPYGQPTPLDPAAEPAPLPEGASRAPAGPCALGPFCFGPLFTLGLANIIGVGAHARYGQFFGFGIDYQFTPTIGYSDAEFSASLITLDVRGYPSGGAFFISGGFAYQMFEAEAEVTYASTTYSGVGTVDLPLLKLGIGFLGHDGLVLGIDLAIEIPLANADIAIDAGQFANDPLAQPAYDAIKKELKDTADGVINLLPFVVQLNLIRIGYIF